MGLLPNNRSDIHFHWLISLIVFTSDFLQVWVLDSNPGLLPKDKSDVAKVMDEVGDIRMPARSREAVLAHLQVATDFTVFHDSFSPVKSFQCHMDEVGNIRMPARSREASGAFWEMPARSAWSCLRICTLQCCQGSHALFGPLLI